MSISEKQLRELIKDEAEIERVSSVSSDGRNLLTRIPKEIRDRLDIKKGNKIRWALKKGEITLEIQDAEEKEQDTGRG
jgi:bifunctional DNA-binding transcriptional regulator/antitoxin component of YhaV-PrlF toxin-antitoxin module